MGGTGGPGVLKVFTLVPGSRTPQLLASGPQIVVHSLAVTAGHVYWLDGATPETATLP